MSFWEMLLDAFVDSLKVLPFLLIIYIIIELLEEKASTQVKFLKYTNGKFATLVGSGIGLIPQCGFSVVASSLYAKKYISMGTLLAIFIATSDEAIPIILSSNGNEIKILPILIIKFLFALVVGYGTSLVLYLLHKGKRKSEFLSSNVHLKSLKNEEHHQFKNHEHHHENIKTKPKNINSTNPQISNNIETAKIENSNSNELNKEELEHLGEHACCGHNVETKKSTFTSFIVHPMVHSLKIFAYILIINILLGIAILTIGENNIANFLQGLNWWQPLIIPIFGLIPNCASSVLITQLYLLNGISFGACVAGLCVNAGLGIAVLLKQNKNKRENITIISILYLCSVALGYILTAFKVSF